MTAYRTWKQRY